ncbi:MAG: O-antigen ligase family protein, partial [Bacteroidota bacterium]
MSVEKRSLLFLFGLLVVLYLTKITPFLDEYTMGRFTVWTLLAYGGLWLVLPYLRRTDVQVLDWSLLAFYCLNLLSVSWAKNFGEAIFTSQKYLLLFVGYYVLRHLLAEGKVHRDQMAKLLLGLSAFVVVLTTYQMAQTYLSEGLGGKAIYKVISLSGHKNLAASYLFLLLCLNIFFAIRRPKAPWFYWLLGFQVLLLLLLRSRAVYLALGTSALISGGYYLTSSVSLRRLALRRVLPFALLLALFGGLLIGNTGVGKDYLRHLNPDTYLTSGSGSERLFVWYKTWDLIVDQPWLGCGSGNWKLLFPSKNLSGGYRLQEKDVVFTRVHNDLLEVWAEVGTLGLLLFLVIFGWAFAAAVDRLRRGKLVDQQEGIVLIATLVGYLVVSFFDFPKERPEHQVLLSLLLAIAAFRGKEWLAKRPAYFSLSPTARHKGSLILSFVLLVNL